MVRHLVGLMTEYNVFVVAARAIQKKLKESAYKLVVDTIRSFGLTDDFEILVDEIRHKVTGARMIFVGLEGNPDGIKSLESAHILWVEEADSVKLSTWRVIIPTMRAPGWEIWATWNPHLPSDAVEKVWEENAYRGIREHLTYLDNPELDASKVEEAERMKETDYESYAHIYLGHYRPAGDNNVIPLKYITDSMARETVHSKAPKIAALDPALLGNDTAGFAIRQENSVTVLKEWAKLEAPDLERVVRDECIRHGVDVLVIDADGLGSAIHQHLKRDMPGIRVLAHHGNGASPDAQYSRARAYVWFRLRDAMRDGLSLPDNRKLAEELQRQTYGFDANGKYWPTPKDKMREEGIASPNLADAVCMTYSPVVLQAEVRVQRERAPKRVLTDMDHGISSGWD